MKNTVVLLVLAVLGAILVMSGCGTYNTLVTKDETVENAWGKVQSAYQRRADLIPNLVNTVKGAADFEQETLSAVMEARSRATSINIDAGNVTPEKIKQFQQAQGALSSSLGRLLAVSENYPQLRATANFTELQAQLEGTENRIKVARDNYNDAVTVYNTTVRRFPAALFAGLFGFDRKGLFEAEAGAQNAPTVEF